MYQLKVSYLFDASLPSSYDLTKAKVSFPKSIVTYPNCLKSIQLLEEGGNSGPALVGPTLALNPNPHSSHEKPQFPSYPRYVRERTEERRRRSRRSVAIGGRGSSAAAPTFKPEPRGTIRSCSCCFCCYC